MTQEERQLVLIDLCGRFPHGVKIDREWIAPMTGSPEHTVDEFSTFDIEILSSWLDEEGAGLTTCDDGRPHWVRKYSCKPYLRPMSSMTEEENKQREELGILVWSNSNGEIGFDGFGNISAEDTLKALDWLNAHHFDYRGLIEKGLALEAPRGMYNLKEK